MGQDARPGLIRNAWRPRSAYETLERIVRTGSVRPSPPIMTRRSGPQRLKARPASRGHPLVDGVGPAEAGAPANDLPDRVPDPVPLRAPSQGGDGPAGQAVAPVPAPVPGPARHGGPGTVRRQDRGQRAGIAPVDAGIRAAAAHHYAALAGGGPVGHVVMGRTAAARMHLAGAARDELGPVRQRARRGLQRLGGAAVRCARARSGRRRVRPAPPVGVPRRSGVEPTGPSRNP